MLSSLQKIGGRSCVGVRPTHTYIEEPSVPSHQNRRSGRSRPHSLFLVEKYCLCRDDRAESKARPQSGLARRESWALPGKMEYGTFSVSESNVEAVTAYISDQAEHHRKFSYQEELRELLKRHRSRFRRTLSLRIMTDPRPPFKGDSSRGRLPRAEAHGLFCFRPSGDPKCPNLQAA